MAQRSIAPRRRGARLVPVGMRPVALLLAGLLLIPLMGPAPITAQAAEVSVEDITDNPDRYIGQQVTVRDEITSVVSQRAFRVGDRGFLGFGGAELLVIGARTLPEWFGPEFDVSAWLEDEDDFSQFEGMLARVTGTVRRFDQAAVERDLGIQLEADRFDDLNGDPVLVAQSVQLIFRASEIADNPDQFLGQRMAVTGEITDVIGPRTFVMGDEGVLGIGESQILVMSRNDLNVQLEEGRTAQTTGILGVFDLRAFEQAIGADLSDTAFADWDNRPVLIITSVQLR